MHINYAEVAGRNFAEQTIDSVCRLASSLGYNGVEFRGVAPACLGDISFLEYAKQIAKAKERYGLTDIMFGMGVGDAASRDKSARDTAVAFAVERAKIAREICDTRVCNTSATPVYSKDSAHPHYSYEFHGSAASCEEDWVLTVDTYQRIAVELEKLGVRFAYETHMNYLHDLPATARRLVDMIDSPMVGINLDYGNSVYFPKPPSLEDAIDICGDKLFYTHLKNSVGLPDSGRRFPVALSEGAINHRLYVKKLAAIDFQGPIGIEAPRPGDRYWFAKCDIEYFKLLYQEL